MSENSDTCEYNAHQRYYPNLSTVREVKKISFGENVLYEPESGLRGLSEDETAIAALMIDTAKYSRCEGEPPYSMEDAFADAYAAILLNEAVRTGKKEGVAT